MESTDYLLSFVLYYGRQKLYYNMQKLAVDGLLKFPEERVYALLNGFALALGDRKVEAARVLSGLQSELNLSLATLLALNFNSKMDNLKLEQNFSNLVNYFKMEENNFQTKANAFYYTALFFYLIEDYASAENFIDHVLEFKKSHEPSLILKAWIQLKDFRSMNKIPFAIEYVLKQDPSHNIDASFCKVKYLQLLNEYDKGINQLNMISIRYPEISIPLVEKLCIQLTTFSWEQAQETTLRIINLEPQNIMALCTKAMLLLCRENNFKLTLHVLKHLFTATDVIEHGNHIALLRICQLFARMCSRNTDVLNLILHTLNKLVRDYVHATTANVDYLNEIAQQWLMLYNYKEAHGCFQAILRVERNNFLALCGLTQCQFIENPNNILALKQQIEFISKLDGNVERTSGYILLCARIHQRAETLPLLIEAAELHLMSLKNCAFGIEYMHQLNPDLLIEFVVQFLLIAPAHFMHNQQFVVEVETFHIAIKHSLCLLEAILHVCPAHLHANFLRAVVHLVCCEYLHALQVLKNLTDKEEDFSSFIDAQLLLAHIQIQQEQYDKAKEALDKALTSDFTVREYAIYHLLMGKLQHHQKQFTEAKKSFITALHIVGNKTASTKSTITTNKCAVHFSGLFNLKTDKGKIMLYLELIFTLRDLKDFTASEHYMQNAMVEFYGTPEEGQLLIAQAKIFLQDFHYTKALNLLNSIEPDQPFYLQSKTLLADIYLKHCKNRVLFAKCFKDILELRPQMDSFLMLGEAYLAIQEPELAIETYRKAFNCNPGYTLLASKLGHAYIKTHQYTKAIEHYQMALAHANNKTLKIDLTDLYLLLRQYKNAEKALSCELETPNSQFDDDLDVEIRTRELFLLAHIHEKLNNIPIALKILQNALSLQKNITTKKSVSNIKQDSTTRICLLLAQLYTRSGSLPQAELYYQECLKSCATNVQALLGLAQLYMQMNSMESCSNICRQLLQIEPTNQDASVMLADILFRKMEFTKAVQHFSALLKCQPHYWTALVRLIEIMHRLDKISHVCEFLERAEQLRIEGNKDTPGLIYCQALYKWYTSNLDVALKLFNNVRRDFEWGQQATSNMIEIYLNVDENIVYVYGNDAYNFNDIAHNTVNTTVLTTAESLLTQFRPKLEHVETYNLKLLENLLHIASNQEERIKMALHYFRDMHSSKQYQNKLGLVFGTSLAYIKLKELCEAKVILKSVIHTPWSFEESSYLEGCWLLIAYIYLQEHKLESALNFLQRILEVNKSHIKANELAGFITEKCELYAKSVSYYSKAWHLCAKTKPYIGYKLAYCLQKLNRNADALHVCQQLLKFHPDFQVIKNDILFKCRLNIRT